MSSSSSEWYEIEIGQLGKVVTGNTPSTKKPEFYGDKYPFITPSDLDFGSRTVQTERFLSERGKEKLSSRLLPADAVCFTSIGATIGKMCMTTRQSFTNQQINSIIVDKTQHDPRFVYYLLRHNTEQIKMLAGGAATPIVSKSKFAQAKVVVPHPPTQRKIAAILSAYDDLIENNTRRIATLEQMAQTLYREWFVHFRFPGHEQVALVDSSLGSIPEGWGVVIFTDIADVLSGGTPKTRVPEYWNGSIPFFSPRDVQSSFYVTETERSITDLGLVNCSSQLYPKNTVFITARGTVGTVVMPAVDMAMNQSCYALKGRDGIEQHFVFLAIRSCVDQLRAKAHGAVFDTVIMDTFRTLEVVRPPFALIKRLHSLVSPIFDQVLNLVYRNGNLRRTRDLLLPRLISGEVDVAGLDH